MIRLLLCLLLGLVAGLAGAVELATIANTAGDQPIAATGLAEGTVVVTSHSIRLVDWSRPEGHRDSLLVRDFGSGMRAYTWEDGTAYVGSRFDGWRAVQRYLNGDIHVTDLGADWPPSTRIGGQLYHLECWPAQVTVFPAFAGGDALSSVSFDPPPGADVATAAAGDRAVGWWWQAGQLSVQAVDLSDPAQPVLGPVSTFACDEVTGVVVRDRALFAVGSLLQSFDLTEVTQVTALDVTGPVGEFSDPVMRDDGMLAVWHGYDLRLFDCSDPANLGGGPTAAQALGMADHPGPIAVDAHRIVAVAYRGLMGITEAPRQYLIPSQPGGLTDGGVAWWRVEGKLIATAGQWAWVQGRQRYALELHGGDSGLMAVASAEDNGGISSTLPVFLAHHAGHLLFVRGGNSLAIEDVADPVAPVTVASLDFSGGIDAVDLNGDLLAVAHEQVAEFYDVGSPASPALLGTLPLDRAAAALSLRGERPYLVEREAALDDRVLVLDLADATAPTVSAVHDLDDGDPLTAWQVDGHVLHGSDLLLRHRDVAESELFVYTVQKLNLADPAQPVVTAYPASQTVEFWGTGYPDPMVTDFCNHHVVLQESVVSLYDYPGKPIVTSLDELDHRHLDEVIRGVSVIGTRLAVLAPPRVVIYTIGGTEPVGVPEPLAAAAVTVAPNPFNPRASVAFVLDRAGRATVAIHDLRGRRVRTLAAELPAGPASLAWDGADDQGRALPSGTYLLRVTAPGVRATTRCSLVR